MEDDLRTPAIDLDTFDKGPYDFPLADPIQAVEPLANLVGKIRVSLWNALKRALEPGLRTISRYPGSPHCGMPFPFGRHD